MKGTESVPSTTISRPQAPAVHPLIRAAAYLVPLCTVPSVSWRISLYSPSVEGSWYPVLLSLLEFGLAFLTVGLVHRWGETVPRWVPGLGGRTLSIRAVTAAAITGAVLVILICTYGVLNYVFEFVSPAQARSIGPTIGGPGPANATGAGDDVALLYLSTLLWGPLLLLCAIAYYRRRIAYAS